MTPARRRLLTIGHSYCVWLNRRLALALSRAAGDRWEVVLVAPARLRTDLGTVATEVQPEETFRIVRVPLLLDRPIHLMAYGRAVRRVLHEGWDLVHCWEEPYILAGAQLAWWTPRATPLVYSTYQNLTKRYPAPFAHFERYAMRRAAGWIGGGSLVAETLRQRPGYADKPHAVIPMGVDCDLFRPDPAARARTLQRLGWSDSGPPTVGYLGRFVDEKGVSLLTRVLPAIARPWRALLVGAGPLEESLRRWAHTQGDRVRVETGVPHAKVWEYLNAMDLLCVPSRTTPAWREQFGRVIIEAFASGVPVIGSDSGEIPRVLGDTGIAVSESDQSAWIAAIDRLPGDGELRRHLVSGGRHRAETEYAWPAIARRTLAFFEEILDPRRAPRVTLW